MHEGAIAHSIVKIVNSEINSRGLTSNVKKVVFSAGKMNLVVPESLGMFFDVIKREHPWLSDAVLEVREVPLVVHCPHCRRSTEIAEPDFSCGVCGGPLSIESGKDMFVESICF